MATTAPKPVDDDPLDHLLPPRRIAVAPPVDREPGDLDMVHRLRLADRIHGLMTDADHARRDQTTPQRAHRLQVKDARGRLQDVESALRSGIPIRRRGERLVVRLLSEDALGTYCCPDARTLHDDADAACIALGVVTPFH
jgi:hypothetical protein